MDWKNGPDFSLLYLGLCNVFWVTRMNTKKWRIAPTCFLMMPFLVLALLPSPISAKVQRSSQAAASETYSYDDAGRLTQVSYGDGSSIGYSYDANGNILGVVVTGSETVFLDGFEG